MSTYTQSPDSAELIVGSPFLFHVDFFQGDGTTPMDLTGVALKAVVRTSGGGHDLACDTSSRQDPQGGVDVQLTATQTGAVATDHDSRLLVTYVDGVGQDVIFEWPLHKVRP